MLPTSGGLDANLLRERHNLRGRPVLLLVLVSVPQLTALVPPPRPEGPVLAHSHRVVLPAGYHGDRGEVERACEGVAHQGGWGSDFVRGDLSRDQLEPPLLPRARDVTAPEHPGKAQLVVLVVAPRYDIPLEPHVHVLHLSRRHASSLHRALQPPRVSRHPRDPRSATLSGYTSHPAGHTPSDALPIPHAVILTIVLKVILGSEAVLRRWVIKPALNNTRLQLGVVQLVRKRISTVLVGDEWLDEPAGFTLCLFDRAHCLLLLAHLSHDVCALFSDPFLDQFLPVLLEPNDHAVIRTESDRLDLFNA
mmetsp:Transcript_35976/g.86895  ORF Transcript_35976/g.86895 Transcript_35976/m.86895 type:complete len:307 (-) Transcript_35976:2893-3813(-)